MIFLFFLALFPSTAALSWPIVSKRPTDVLFALTTDDDYSMSQEQIDSIFLNPSAIQAFSNKPDCFRRAAGYMRVQCANLEMDEDHRVKVAISMTLCELATAKHHTPPMECIPFAEHNSHDSSKGPRDCVEALSRSAQFWSSYSGYLRETNTAKAIYHNSTLEKVALLRFMIDREKRSDENARELETFLEVMHGVLTSLRSSSENADVAVAEHAVLLQSVLQKILTDFDHFALEFRRQQENDYAEAVSQFRSNVGQISLLHEKSLESAASSFENAVRYRLDNVFQAIRERNHDLTHLTNAVRDEWVEFNGVMTTAHQSMIRVSGEADRVVGLLQSQSDLVLETQQIHLEAAQSAEHLVDVVNMLTATTRLELQHVNETALALRDKLVSSLAFDYYSLSSPAIFDIVSKFLKVDLSYLSHLFQYPLLRLIAVMARFFASIIHLVFSALMSIILLSSRKLSSKDSATSSLRKCSNLSITGLKAVDSAPGSSFSASGTLEWEKLHQEIYTKPSRSRPRISRIPDRLLRPSDDYTL